MLFTERYSIYLYIVKVKVKGQGHDLPWIKVLGIGIHGSVKECTVKPVYNCHPRDWSKLAVIDR